MHRKIAPAVLAAAACLLGCEPTPAYPPTRPWFSTGTQSLLREPNVMIWDGSPLWLDGAGQNMVIDEPNNVVVLNPGDTGHWTSHPLRIGKIPASDIPQTQPLPIVWHSVVTTVVRDQALVLEADGPPTLMPLPPDFALRTPGGSGEAAGPCDYDHRRQLASR